MLAGIWAKLAGYAVAIGGALLAIFAYGRSQKNKGRKEVASEVNASSNKTILKVVEEDKEIEESNDAKSDDAVLNELLGQARDNDNNQ